MSILHFLLRGVYTGLIVSVPLGPVGLVTIENTIARGKKAGICSALAVAAIDITAAGLILFGFHDVLPYFHSVPAWLKIIGSLVIFCYGILLFQKKVQEVLEAQPISQTFLETLLVIVFNPATYLSFGITAILFSHTHPHTADDYGSLFSGFIIAVLSWWTILIIAADTIRKKFLKRNILHKIIGTSLMISALGIFVIPLKVYTPLQHILKIK